MHIENFVFFDMETTGLPNVECNKTRITEICFVVVRHDHLGVYPRVQNKITFCFNPQREINEFASKMSGLSNELLQSQCNFGPKACDMINIFLELQSKPICLVAHNGNTFDYPILKAEFDRAGCKLIEHLYYIDSRQMCRQIRTTNKYNFGNSLKLGDIYKDLTGRRCESAHEAGVDVDMLIECAVALGEDFINWATANAKNFAEITMMYWH